VIVRKDADGNVIDTSHIVNDSRTLEVMQK